MKLDYNFIKEILLTMEEYDKHEIYSYELWQKIGAMDSKQCINNDIFDKLIGHIKILSDNNCIKSKNDDFGVKLGINKQIITYNTPYRLTAQGYEFLDALKKDSIFNQLVDLALPTALKIGTQLLTQTIWEKIKSGV